MGITGTYIRAAFTLVEVMMAMSIGLLLLNTAFVAFVSTGKFIRRIESIAAKNDVAQSVILWSFAKNGLADYPTDVPQSRRIGVSGINNQKTTYTTVTISEMGSTSPLIRPVIIVLPGIESNGNRQP